MIQRIKYVALFYIIAIAIRYYFVVYEPSFLALIPDAIKGLLQGISPFISGIILIYCFKRSLNYSLFSIGIKQTIFLIVLPVVLFVVASLFETETVTISLPLLILSSILYGFFEEFGWRGYLHSELNNIRRMYKYIIISILWYVWHLDFGFDTSHLLSYLYILAGSIGIGYVADKSKSLILPALFHAFFNILLSNSLLSISLKSKIIIVIISIVSIIVVMIFTKKKENKYVT
ncbi:MAG TPA: CPBP family intramembrane metalloprotease [Bacteroidetes bacterium]|nr:CPBP family intramembrane metalloprotease [Bacteroidota bacterium]